MFSKTGVGIRHLPTLVPIRVLDCVDRYRENRQVLENYHAHVCYKVAAQPLGGTMKGMVLLGRPMLDELWNNRVQAFKCIANIMGADVYEGRCSYKSIRVGIFTDGSYFPEPRDKAGAAIVLPSGQVWIFGPSGKQTCYKAELLALVLASDVAFPHEFIWTDSQGCLKGIEGTN